MLPIGGGWLASFFYFFLRLGPAGLFLLGVLDSSFLTLPFANDFAVILLVSLHHDWLLPCVAAATLGSVVGCYIMYKVGEAGGENFIRARVSPQRFERIHKKVKGSGPFVLALPGIIPPPFPFSIWVLAAGALEVPVRTFLATLGGVRCARFLLEGLAAMVWGRRIVTWMNSRSFHLVIDGLVVIAIAASALSIYELIVQTRKGRKPPQKRAHDHRRHAA